MLDTYPLKMVRLKDGVVPPLSVSSSVVVFPLASPMSSTPRGEAQAAWPCLLCPGVWLFFHLPLVNVVQHLSPAEESKFLVCNSFLLRP